MTDWTDYTQCSECGKQCQNGGHCIGGMGGKDTKCPGFIQYVPKIRVEKDVWESTLNRSMVLEAQNAQLKELLEWCRDELFEIYSNEVSHPEDVPIIKKLAEVLK